MRAGKLRSYVTIQQRAATRTAAGDQDTTWTDVFSAYALIEGSSATNEASGRERDASGAVRNVALHKITMRHDPRLTTAGQRVKYGTRIFNITTPPRNVDDRSEMMVFQAEEGLTND